MRLEIGQRVRVPWGVGEAVGVIREIYGPPGHPFALVAFPISGSADGAPPEEHTVSLPLDALEAVDAPASA